MKKIFPFAFGECTSLTSVTLPEGVLEMREMAFAGCTSLVSITIPSTLTAMGDSVFGDCISLTEINVQEGNKQYGSIDGVLFNHSKTKLILYPSGKTQSEYVVPDGVRAVGIYSFLYCTHLGSVVLPDSLQSIDSFAFYGCSSLGSVTIPKNVQQIGSDVFTECYSLREITVSEGNRYFV